MPYNKDSQAERRRSIEEATRAIEVNYTNAGFTVWGDSLSLPDRKKIIEILSDFQSLFFPAFYGVRGYSDTDMSEFAQTCLRSIYDKTRAEIALALAFRERDKDHRAEAGRLTSLFIEKAPEIQRRLMLDAQAHFEGDPAAKSIEEVIFSYPGFYAIFVYRIAHELYTLDVPFVPRIMTECAHAKTGIDINPGAEIGNYFFIDHGTGVVIGETTKIGDHVKLYQGVTLGALSPRKGQKLSGLKRHPTVKDNATIYSGATILGGETVIGENAVIGGNSFITESVPDNARVSIKTPELIIK